MPNHTQYVCMENQLIMVFSLLSAAGYLQRLQSEQTQQKKSN